MAKRDGEWTAEVVTRYLETQPLRDRAAAESLVRRLRTSFVDRGIEAVTIDDLRLLEEAEKQAASSPTCIGEFKYATNAEMLALIRQKRDRVSAAAAR